MRAAAGAEPVLGLRPPAMVARKKEWSALGAALSAPGAVVRIEGEAGIGKTRLIHEYLHSAAGRVRKSLVASCPPFRRPYTFGPLVTALTHAVDDVGRLRLSPLAGALRPLFPEWSDRLPAPPDPAPDAGVARHRVCRALDELMDALSIDLLVVEDAHWADEASLEFILSLLAETSRRFSMVYTCRPDDVPASPTFHCLSNRGAAGAPITRLVLGPLDVAGTAEMVSSMLSGEQVSDEFAAFVHQRTEGLPLAIEESVRLMGDRRDLARRDGEWVRRRLDRIEVPPTIRDAVLERIQRQDAGTQRLLQAAAVLGTPADLRTLAAVAGLPIAEVRDGLNAALSCGLMREDARGQAGFRHVLDGQAVYEAIPPPERRLFHRRAATALEYAVPQSIAVVANHLRESGETATWCVYGERAADMAIASGDETTAAVLLKDLVVHGRPPPALMVRLAAKVKFSAFGDSLDVQDLIETLRAAADSGTLDRGDEGSVRAQLARSLMAVEQYDEAFPQMKRAAPLLPPDSAEALMATSLLGMAVDTTTTAAEHHEWLARASTLLDALPAAPEKLGALINQTTGLLTLGDEAGWDMASAIPEETDDAAERMQMARADLNIGQEAILWGRYEEAARRLQKARTYGIEHGHPRIYHDVDALQARLHWCRGEWNGLAPRLKALLDTEAISPVARLETEVILILVESAQAGRTDIATSLAEIVEHGLERGALECATWAAGAMVRHWLQHGQHEAALAAGQAPMVIVRRKQVWLLAAELAPHWVEARCRAGQVADAEQCVAAFADGLGDVDAPTAQAALALSQAVLTRGTGDQAAAAVRFDAAARLWEAMPRPYDASLARRQQAECLMDSGDRPVDLLKTVLDGFTALGARPDAVEAIAALRRCGVDVRRPWRGGRRSYGGELSPREVDVVRLLVGGLTNREIGDKLYLSPKTVARHLDSAMRKRGVSSRTALAVRVVEDGLVANGGSKLGRLPN